MNYDHAIGYENRILYFAPFFGLHVAGNDAFVCLFVVQRLRKHGIISNEVITMNRIVVVVTALLATFQSIAYTICEMMIRIR